MNKIKQKNGQVAIYIRPSTKTRTLRKLKTQLIYNNAKEPIIQDYTLTTNPLPLSLVPLTPSKQDKELTATIDIPISNLVYKFKNDKVLVIQTISLLNQLYIAFAPTSQVLSLSTKTKNTFKQIHPNRRYESIYLVMPDDTRDITNKQLKIEITNNIVQTKGIKWK